MIPELALTAAVIAVAIVQECRVRARDAQIEDLDGECLDLTRLAIKAGREKAEAIERLGGALGSDTRAPRISLP